MPYIRKWRKYRLVRVDAKRGATDLKRRLLLFPFFVFLLIPTCIEVPVDPVVLNMYVPKTYEPRRRPVPESSIAGLLPVPEPSSSALLIAGLGWVIIRRRR